MISRDWPPKSAVWRVSGRGEQGLDEAASGLAIPGPGPRRASDQPALAVDDVERWRAPHPVDLPRHIAALVDQHGRGVAPVLHRLPDTLRILLEVDEKDLKPLGAIFLVELLDGRQLLPTGWSPRGPEEQHHDLAPKIGERDGLPGEVRQREGRRGLRWLVRLHLHAGEVGRGRRQRRERRRSDERYGHQGCLE